MTIQFWTAISPQKKIYNHLFHEEVEIAVAALKKGKCAGIDNIPAKLVQAGEEVIIDVLKAIYEKIWRTENGLHHGLSR